MMIYKGYSAEADFDETDKILVGRVIGIKTIIGFHGESAKELEANFHQSINHYLKVCQTLNKEPEKPIQDVLWLGHPNTTSIWSVQFFHYTINEEVELLEMLENTVGTKNISLLIAIVHNFLCGKTQIVWHLGNHFTCLHQLQSLLKGSFANCSDIKHYCVHVHTSVRIYSKS